MEPVLRPSSPDDQEFLFQLYASTRQAEIAAFGWSGAQQEAFLRMQFSAQQRWYQTAYAQAEEQIVMLEKTPIGRMIVQRGAEAAILVDISLLFEYRGRGIGGGLLRNLLEQCGKQGMAVRLQVLKNNLALRLYERLGFLKTSEDQMYFQMERRPD